MPRRPEEKAPKANDRPRQPADPEATNQSLQGARESLERLRRYLRATQPGDDVGPQQGS
jgi:hypothetical protein